MPSKIKSNASTRRAQKFVRQAHRELAAGKLKARTLSAAIDAAWDAGYATAIITARTLYGARK